MVKLAWVGIKLYHLSQNYRLCRITIERQKDVTYIGNGKCEFVHGLIKLVTKFPLYLLLTVHVTTQKSGDILTTSFSNKNCFKLFLSGHSPLWEFLNLNPTFAFFCKLDSKSLYIVIINIIQGNKSLILFLFTRYIPLRDFL